MVLIIASMSRAVMTEEMAEGEKEEKKKKTEVCRKLQKRKQVRNMFKLPDFVYIACTLGMKHNIKVESYTQNTNTHRHPHTKPFIKTQAYHRTA